MNDTLTGGALSGEKADKEESALINKYYLETQPERRRELLDKILSNGRDDSVKAYMAALFESRHVDPKDPGRLVDRFLFQCVNFIQIARAHSFFKKSNLREVRKIMASMRMGEAKELGEAGEITLYRELSNTTLRYLESCGSSAYSRTLFRMMSSGDEARAHRVAKDIYEMTDGLSGKYGLEEELDIWNRAVRDTYFSNVSDGRKRYEKITLDLKGRKRRG